MTKPAFARAAASVAHTMLVDKHVAALAPMLLKHPAIKATFNMLPRKLRQDAWLIHYDKGTAVSIGLSIRNLSGFKDKALIATLAPFTGNEWYASTSDWPGDQPNRDFRFQRDVPMPEALASAIARHPSARWLQAHGEEHRVPRSVSVSVYIYAYVRSDSPTCRTVVKGFEERVVREEIKEIVCD